MKVSNACCLGKVSLVSKPLSKVRLMLSLIAIIFCPILLVSAENPTGSKRIIRDTDSSVSQVRNEDNSNVNFRIQSFQFEGLEAFSPKVLWKTLEDFRDIPLQFDDLSQVVSSVEAYYKEKGKIVSAKIPPQDITDGTLIINLSEARVGKIIIDPNGSSQVKNTMIKLSLIHI